MLQPFLWAHLYHVCFAEVPLAHRCCHWSCLLVMQRESLTLYLPHPVVLTHHVLMLDLCKNSRFFRASLGTPLAQVSRKYRYPAMAQSLLSPYKRLLAIHHWQRLFPIPGCLVLGAVCRWRAGCCGHAGWAVQCTRESKTRSTAAACSAQELS